MQIIVLINAPNRSYSQKVVRFLEAIILPNTYFATLPNRLSKISSNRSVSQEVSKKQLVQPKLSVRTDRFHRMTNFWISLKTGTEQIVFPGEKHTPNTFFTEQIRWLLSYRRYLTDYSDFFREQRGIPGNEVDLSCHFYNLVCGCTILLLG